LELRQLGDLNLLFGEEPLEGEFSSYLEDSSVIILIFFSNGLTTILGLEFDGLSEPSDDFTSAG
jgi:hypothetical protein